MPFLQAQLIQPNIGDHTVGVDLSVLGQLILDDPFHRLGRDSQPARDLLSRTADQRPQYELLEAVCIGHVFAFEWWNDVLAVIASPTAMEGSLIDPKRGLVPDVEIPNDRGRRFELDVGGLLVTTFFTLAPLG